MSKHRLAFVLIGLLVLSGFPAELRSNPQDRQRLEARLEREESRARRQAAMAAEKYAGWCAGTGAYAEARRYLNVASLVAKEDFGGRDFEKLRDREDEISESYEKHLDTQRERLLKGGSALLDFAVSARRKDGEDFSREASAIWLTFFYDEAALEDEGWVYEEYFGRIMPREDAERMETEVRHNGEWLDAEAIEAHDKAHATFDDPTTLSDGTMVLYSELPLRESLRMMNYASRFRVFLLSRLGGELKLRHPNGLMPIYAAKDRDSYHRRGKEITANWGEPWAPGAATGWHLDHPGETLCPIVFSPYVSLGDGTAYRGDDSGVNFVIRHELTHMLVSEGLKHNEIERFQGMPPVSNMWVQEGLATWAEYFYWDDDERAFRYAVRRLIPSNRELGKFTKTRFARIVEMRDRTQNIEDFAMLTKQEFDQSMLDSYAQSCAQAVFLMEHSAETREKFFELAIQVHIKDATTESFAEIFEGVDMAELNKEFRAWIDAIELVE